MKLTAEGLILVVITRQRVGRMAARWQAPAGDPVRRSAGEKTRMLLNTGYSAFAEYDGESLKARSVVTR